MKNIIILSPLLFMGLASTTYADTKTACYQGEGMTCTTCSLTLKVAVKKIEGIVKVDASVEKKNAIISYDSKKTNTKTIGKKIDSTGYKSTPMACPNTKG